MEFFNKAKAVRLKSHIDKYLVADEDEETVRQSSNGVSKRARWLVEKVQGNPHVIRLKSCNGSYLTASDEDFLLGMTGKKVILQAFSNTKRNGSIEWEPIKEGTKVKLRTKGCKFLRANGATIPWRNSVTHDLPHRTATQDWVMWDVDVVDISVLDDQEYLAPSNASSFISRNDEFSCPNSPSVVKSETLAVAAVDSDGSDTPKRAEHMRKLSIFSQKRWLSSTSDHKSSSSSRKLDGVGKSSQMSIKQDGMEFFKNAKSVRLQSHLGKYLVADDDEETVRQSRNGAAHKARWTVEFVEGKSNKIRLKSSHGLYLTAVDEPFVLRMTGKKILQTRLEKKTDVTVEWEPIKEGLYVKLMTNDEKFLRANGGAPPWRNSVTHDVPHRTATQSWVLWGVDIMDISMSDQDPSEGESSPTSSISSLDDFDYAGSPVPGSPRAGTGSPMSHNLGMSDSSMSPKVSSPMYRKSRMSDSSMSEKVPSPMSRDSRLSDSSMSQKVSTKKVLRLSNK